MVLPRRKSKVPPPLCPPHACPLHECMKILGGAWTPNILWCLSGEPRRFSELKSDIPGVSSKVLSGRLRELQVRGVLTRTVVDTSPPTVEYALTKLGRELMPVVNAIERVGTKLLATNNAMGTAT